VSNQFESFGIAASGGNIPMIPTQRDESPKEISNGSCDNTNLDAIVSFIDIFDIAKKLMGELLADDKIPIHVKRDKFIQSLIDKGSSEQEAKNLYEILISIAIGLGNQAIRK
jgi:hypothetical protein